MMQAGCKAPSTSSPGSKRGIYKYLQCGVTQLGTVSHAVYPLDSAVAGDVSQCQVTFKDAGPICEAFRANPGPLVLTDGKGMCLIP